MSDDVIRFQAVVAKAQTLVDGGLRITLDLPETAIEIVAKLMQVKREGAVLEIAAVPVLQKGTEDDGKVCEGSKRQSEWATAEESGANQPA